VGGQVQHHFLRGGPSLLRGPLDRGSAVSPRLRPVLVSRGRRPRRYSFWAADALLADHLVQPDTAWLTGLLPDLVANYEAWQKTRRDPNGLFWQVDGQDGMEVSVGGTGYRATINSYLFGDALAIARIADMTGRKELVERFWGEAARIKTLVLDSLWDEGAEFFKVRPRGTNAALVTVRELHGFTPWYFNLSDARFALFEGQKWLLWYNGRHGGLEQIGVVFHEGLDLGFP
jgi:hypothetical protein